ncbi:hypothetical protein GCM10017586_25390 [Microbacterium imperiale]|uniref:Uncharacterized protein n=2 Tax=Microbacterium imperiale TaxID=33884 RepID=A0A9W6HHZ2_9MICO|nr:hypothetical protein GCM10017544_28600 [Microbacterium imperiale]GLJ80856.1 hypothetical protein GCM10017586_25390 [Microbacterium imperiale]
MPPILVVTRDSVVSAQYARLMSKASPLRTDVLATSEVFNPGQFPRHTYSPRATEESAVNSWWVDRGKILVVNGPSKTGKTVLVQKLLGQHNPIWIDGHGLTSTSVMWARIADQLGLFTGVERSTAQAEQIGATVASQVGLSGTNVSAGATVEESSAHDVRFTVERPIELVVREALLGTERPLVIDDIHFVARDTQEEIIKALKPLVFGSQTAAGRRVVFISIGNRVINVLTSLDDMRGRMLPLAVDYWNTDELTRIARDGFVKLRVVDADNTLATRLAEQSFGSPQLMQQLCRELVSGPPNDISSELAEVRELDAPSDWKEFFEGQLLDDIKGWVTKLAKGPETRGSDRKLVPLKSGQSVDGYQLILRAVASTGPKLELTKDELRSAIGSIVAIDPPPKTVPTATIKNMSLIAATKLLEKLPSLQALQAEIEAGMDPYARADLQPVLEYRDSGATSVFTITDPFFAYYLAWGIEGLLAEINAPTPTATTRSAEEAKVEAEEWGDLG